MCNLCVGQIRSNFIYEFFVAICSKYCHCGEWSRFDFHPRMTNILNFLEQIGIILVIDTLDSYWVRPLGVFPSGLFEYKVCVCSERNHPSPK